MDQKRSESWTLVIGACSCPVDILSQYSQIVGHFLLLSLQSMERFLAAGERPET